jgi:serine/threonine protein kinase
MLQNILSLNNTVSKIYRVIVYIYSVETYGDGCVAGIEGEECRKKWCGQYEAIKVLGRGAFGKILLAKRKSAGGPGCNQEVVAIKVVAQEDDRDLVEKEVLMRAVGHPFLVQLLSFFRSKVFAVFLNIHVFTQLLVLKFTISIKV